MRTLIRKLLDILNGSERRIVAALAVLMTVVAFFEVVGLASVMPLLALVGDPGIIHSNAWAAKAYALLGAESEDAFILYCGMFSLAMLIISNGVRFSSSWAMLYFSHALNRDMSSRLFLFYILQPYSYFFTHNSSDISKNILQEVTAVACFIVQRVLMVVSRTTIILAVILFMFVVNPLVSVSVFVCFGGCYVLAYMLTRRAVSSVGRKRVTAMERRYRVSGEAFRSIKEVKALNSEQFFYSTFHRAARQFARYCTVNEVIAMSPRFCLEVVAFGSMIVLIMVFYKSGWNSGHALPLLGMYAFGGMKIMPALQQMFEAITNIKFYSPILDLLHADLTNALHMDADTSTQDNDVPFTHSIRFEQVAFAYAPEAGAVLNDLNLTIRKNEMVGIVGATGAGKTTAIDMLLGLITPTSGSLYVDDVAVEATNMRGWRRHIGYVPQTINLLDDTIRMNIALGQQEEDVDEERLIAAARIANIHDHIMQRLPEGYDSVVGEQGVRLSGGQRQRLGIARALYRGADVLVFDEATSALDGETEQRVMESIAGLAGSKTLVVIAHRLSTLQQCDVIYSFENGRAVRVGSYDDLCARSGLLLPENEGANDSQASVELCPDEKGESVVPERSDTSSGQRIAGNRSEQDTSLERAEVN